MKQIIHVLIIFLSIALVSCKKEEATITSKIENSGTSIIDCLNNNYTQLPEQQIAISNDSSTYVQYINPTTKYTHGILGDQIEAEGLVVYHNGVFIELKLEDNYVFEDLVPRLVDLTGDNKPELVCIRTDRSKGAGIIIYEIQEDTLTEYAYVQEIGTANRWLNIVSIYDLDQDDQLELAWIQTPHIGGILKVADITAGEITNLDEYSTVSNHAIGQTNLCLSGLIEEDNLIKIIVPNQSRDKVLTFNFSGDSLSLLTDTIVNVDFSLPIYEQLPTVNFTNDNNCKF